MRSPERPVDRDAATVDVPVVATGSVPEGGAGPATAGHARPRFAVGVGVAAVLVAVIVVGSVAIQVWSDDRSDERSDERGGSASVDDTPPALLTTPDTLAPLAPRAVANDPLASRPPLELRQIGARVEADLATGVAALSDSTDLVSETYVEVGDGGFAQRMEVSRDGERDRIAATLETPGLREQVIVDARSGVGYVRRGPSSWETFAASDEVVEFWERLLLGPLSPELLAGDERSTVSAGPVVAVEDPAGSRPSPARAFRITASARDLAGWTPFALGPLEGADAIVPATSVELVALVAPGDRLVEVRWTVPFGSTTQVVLHRPRPAVDVEIDLPPTADVTGPAASWIIVPR